ncbi:recombination protein NinB [Caballeronia sp. LZ001]|uniref:recombination protein NinB n=1 Tax=Caballeronia sp. LZ001 TaxID=3038553 RepID=UPI00285FDFD2|nr:recombination protein NinB [Caballeronia sp. LZ001]MDR5802168.1 recombination protein NinB [Caballeronia sp. LZ001]
MSKTFVLRNPDIAHELIAFLKAHAGPNASAGHPLAVTVATHKQARSADQNRLLHALLNDIAQQAVIGGKQYEVDVWKEIVRCKFIGTEEISLPDGTRIERGMSTKTLGVGDFSNLIEIVRAWAQTELGVEV